MQDFRQYKDFFFFGVTKVMLRNVCNLPYCKERLARWSFEAIFVKRLNKKLNNKNQNIGQIPYDQFTQGDKINKYTL